MQRAIRSDATGARSIAAVARSALEWARERDYAGWDPYDGLNSPLFSLARRTPMTRLLAMHFVHRAPVNLRPVLLVPRERNPKGTGLFARAYLYRYERTGDERFLAEAESLLEWLETVRAPDYEDYCWGYNFDWQNGFKFYLEAYDPSIVVSVFCGLAFLHHHRVTGDEHSLDIAVSVADFITSEINVCRINGHEVYSYTPDDSFVVVNANALAMSFLAQVDAASRAPKFRTRADELVSFVTDIQTDSGAWYYSYPRNDSHLSHDNFHTGYVLESLHDYVSLRREAPAAEAAYEHGVQFYRRHLFETDGAPKFDYETTYPRDIHGAAQGIRTFVRDGRPERVAFARTIVDWTVANMYDQNGYFIRRRGQFMDDTTPYIRWNQAWMCLALETFCYYADRTETPPTIAP